MATAYTSIIQQMYVAFFNRPADFQGLRTWEAFSAGKTEADLKKAISAEFAKSDEYTIVFKGMNYNQIVTKVYQNLLNRDPDVAGLQNWVDHLVKGTSTVASLVTDIIRDAGKGDVDTIKNKTAAASKFTEALNTTDLINAYSGAAANAVAATWLKAVGETQASLDAAITAAALTTVTANVAANSGNAVGTTYTLTVGKDTVAGTNLNDTINADAYNPITGAEATTLNATDSIDGGAGADTLNISVISSAAGAGTAFNTVQQGTVKNVEAINIDNTAATNGVFGGAAVDASKFEGATSVNQIARATNVTGLAAGTTAGLKNVVLDGDFDAVTALTQNLKVTAATTAASASIKLDGAKGHATTNVANLDVTGAALSSVTVAGTLAKNNTAAGSDAASLNLVVTAGVDATNKSVSKVTVNTAVKTTLTINESTAAGVTGNVVDVQAYDSTGGITFTGDDKVATILTGAGDDVLTVATATSKTAGSVVDANIGTGAGKDTINVRTAGDGKVAVAAGMNDDTINLAAVDSSVTIAAGAGTNFVAKGTLNVTAGEGNDKVVLSVAGVDSANAAVVANRVVTTSDVIDGGDGTDTVVLAGSTAARTADDFIVFNKVLKNFETLAFSTAEGILDSDGVAAGNQTIYLDASQVGANYTSIEFASDSFANKVAATQTLVANGNLTAIAAGYDAAATPKVYGGNLNITAKGDASTITASGDLATVTVKAGTANVGTTIAGDLKSLKVVTANSVDSATAPTADTIASVTVDTTGGNLANVTSLTLEGNGSATVTNIDGAKLVTIDATHLSGFYTLGTNKDKAITGLSYTTANTAVETVKLGLGLDTLTFAATASVYGKVDTVEGLSLVLNADKTALDTAKSDDIAVTGETAFVKFTTTQTDLDLALKDAAAYVVTATAKDNVVFQLGGNTYIYADNGGNDIVDSSDVLVKLVGTVDLDALVIALG